MGNAKQDIYLEELKLQNFITFDFQAIEFSKGLNCIVGETGSGKSLILEAMQLIFGARSSKSHIRKGADFCSVEASFICDDPKTEEYFLELGFPLVDKKIIIQRIISHQAAGKTTLNHLSCPLNILALFAQKYIDLVGQFQNQRLLRPHYQLGLIDAYAGIEDKAKSFVSDFMKHEKIENEIIELQEQFDSSARELDFLNFQISEIENLELSPGEDQDLLERKKSLQKAQESFESLNLVCAQLSDGPSDILSALHKSISLIEGIDQVKGIHDFKDAVARIEDFSYELGKLRDQFDSEGSKELATVLDRLDKIQQIKRKFNKSIEEILIELDSLLGRKDFLQSIEEKIIELTNISHKCSNELKVKGQHLLSIRQKKARELSTEVSRLIQGHNMQGAWVEFAFTETENLYKYGPGRLHFKGETNPGEGVDEIAKMASGGELSRILLAIRQALSTYQGVSVFLFDEVDSGIGGKTALKIGQALKEVSRNGQVISITHLPQMAAQADRIIFVQKEIQKVSKNERRTISTSLNIIDDIENFAYQKLGPRPSELAH